MLMEMGTDNSQTHKPPALPAPQGAEPLDFPAQHPRVAPAAPSSAPLWDRDTSSGTAQLPGMHPASKPGTNTQSTPRLCPGARTSPVIPNFLPAGLGCSSVHMALTEP